MSFTSGLAGGMSLFNMYGTSKAIQKNNQAAVDAYNLQNTALTFAQSSNWLNAMYAAEEMKRISNIGIMEAKPEIQQQASKVAMSEGVTAGNSKGRMLATYYLQAGQQIGQQNQATESAVNKLAMGVENQNNALQQQKMTAYNSMKSSLITGKNAAFQILSSGITGAYTGASLGSSFSSTNLGKEVEKSINSIDVQGTFNKLVDNTGAFFSGITASINSPTGVAPTNNIMDKYNGYPSGFKSYNPYEF